MMLVAQDPRDPAQVPAVAKAAPATDVQPIHADVPATETSLAGATPVRLSASGELVRRLGEIARDEPGRLRAFSRRAAEELSGKADRSAGGESAFARELASGFAEVGASGSLAAVGAALQHHVQQVSHAAPYGIAVDGADSIVDRVMAALGMNPPPLGPWFPQ